MILFLPGVQDGINMTDISCSCFLFYVIIFCLASFYPIQFLSKIALTVPHVLPLKLRLIPVFDLYWKCVKLTAPTCILLLRTEKSIGLFLPLEQLCVQEMFVELVELIICYRSEMRILVWWNTIYLHVQKTQMILSCEGQNKLLCFSFRNWNHWSK